MNLTKAVERACQEKTLLDALTFICIWESERIVEQARKNEQWDTYFKISLDAVISLWNKKRICNDCEYRGIDFPHLKGFRGCKEWGNCEYPLPYYATPEAIPLGIENDCKVYKRKTK